MSIGGYRDKEKTLRVLIESDSVLVLGFDEALLGYSNIDGQIVAVYDEDVCINILSDGIPFETALQIFYNNFVAEERSYDSPIFIRYERNI